MRQAIDEVLDVLRQRNAVSFAPHVRNRDLLARMCSDKVSAARAGDMDAAREILGDFVRSVRQHSKRSWRGPNHYLYARYITDAFERILSGEPADIALGVRSSKAGRPKGLRTHDARAIAAGYWLLRRKGLKSEQANAKLQNLTGADRTTVQNARKAPYTRAFGYPAAASDSELTKIVAKQPYGKKLLRALKTP